MSCWRLSMFTCQPLLVTFLSISVLLVGSTLAQRPAPSPSVIKTVEVTASMKKAEVGQTVKLTAVAKDAAGNILNEQPSTYFAGPFDIAAADDSGNVKLFGAGEGTAVAIVGWEPGFTSIM